MSDMPLNINLDLSKIVTTVPLIKDGCTARVRLKNITQTERDGATVLRWEFTLAESAPTEDGNEVRPGFPIFVNFGLDRDWLVSKMAKFIDALLGTGDQGNSRGKPARPPLNSETLSRMIGAEAYAKIIVSRSKTTDYVGNDITSLTEV